MATLSAKQALFIEEYLNDLNATQAAIRAGYAKSTADKQASMWVGKTREACPPKMRHVWDTVQERMRERSERVKVSADDVIRQLVRMGMHDPRRLYDEYGNFLPPHELDDDIAMAIEGIESTTHTDKDGNTRTTYKYKLAARTKPLELIGRHLGQQLGQWSDKTQHDVPPDSPLASLIQAINGNKSTLQPNDDQGEQ